MAPAKSAAKANPKPARLTGTNSTASAGFRAEEKAAAHSLTKSTATDEGKIVALVKKSVG